MTDRTEGNIQNTDIESGITPTAHTPEEISNRQWWIEFLSGQALAGQVLAAGSTAVYSVGYAVSNNWIAFNPAVLDGGFFAASAILAASGTVVFGVTGTAVHYLANKFSFAPRPTNEVLKDAAFKFSINGGTGFFLNSPFSALTKKGAAALTHHSSETVKFVGQVLAPLLSGAMTTSVFAALSQVKIGKLDLKLQLPPFVYAQLYSIFTGFTSEAIAEVLSDHIIKHYNLEGEEALQVRTYMPVVVAAMAVEVVNLGKFGPSAVKATASTLGGWMKSGLSNCWKKVGFFGAGSDESRRLLGEGEEAEAKTINNFGSITAPTSPQLQQ